MNSVTYEEVRPLVDLVQYPGNLEPSLRRRAARLAATANAILSEEPDRVLDVGSGGQPLPVLLARRGVRIDAVDHDPVVMKNLGKLLQSEPEEVRERIEVHIKDVRDLPQGQKYPVVTACEILEHMHKPNEVAKVLAERVAPSGMFFITTPFGWMPDPDHKQSPMPTDHRRWMQGSKLVWDRCWVDDSHLYSSGRAQPTEAKSPDWEELVPQIEAESVRLMKFWLGERDRVVEQRNTAWERLKLIEALQKKVKELNDRIDRNPLVVVRRKARKYIPGL